MNCMTRALPRTTAPQRAQVPAVTPRPQRDPDPAAWAWAMGLLRGPGFDLPKQPRRRQGDPELRPVRTGTESPGSQAFFGQKTL